MKPLNVFFFSKNDRWGSDLHWKRIEDNKTKLGRNKTKEMWTKNN